MTTGFLVQDLIRDEGMRLEAYLDSRGVPTIGIGHTGREVHLGLKWTKDQVDAALAMDIANTCKGLDTALPWWRSLDPIRQDVLAEQAFNLGVHGLLGFSEYLRLVHEGKYAAAAEDVMHTLWAKQVGRRADRLARQMLGGIHQSL